MHAIEKMFQVAIRGPYRITAGVVPATHKCANPMDETIW
jgi:hypothetical protein